MKYEELGKLVETAAVEKLREENAGFDEFVTSCLFRYTNNDWGELSDGDKRMNDDAVKTGNDRILASYPFPDDTLWEAVNGLGGAESKLWIITEWDRSVTTLLFPGEY
jgi:hypothetical protein